MPRKLLSTVGKIFSDYVGLDPASRQDFIFRNPILLSPRAWDDFEARSPRPSPTFPPKIDDAKGTCFSVLGTVTRDVSKYLVGSGPIERQYVRVGRGELRVEGAEDHLRNSGDTDFLSPAYVRCLSYWAQHRATQGEWRPAVQLQRLTLAAVQGLKYPTGDEAFEMQIYSTLAWIDIVSRATTDIPDGRLFRHALDRGRALQLEAERRGDSSLRSELLKRLGILHLDPYVTGRTSHSYLREIRQWQTRRPDDLNMQIDLRGEKDPAMPEPIPAFSTAIEFLTEASKGQTGVDRAVILKPLAEARFWLFCAGGPLDGNSLVNTAKEAIGLFNPGRHQALISGLNELVEFVDGQA